LQLNLPGNTHTRSRRQDDDLVVATHGRSFWVLDNLTPLRQVNAQSASDVILYQPQTALRLHYPEEFDKRQPVGDNPPAWRDDRLLFQDRRRKKKSRSIFLTVPAKS
jgi:hypothetical protein